MNPFQPFQSLRFLAVAIACCISFASAAPYGPDGHETSWIQPNGKKIELRVFGDEFYGRTETVEGFTVIFNNATQAYEFAKKGGDGQTLKSTGVDATKPAPAGLAKHLDNAKPQIAKIRKERRAKLAGDRDARWKEKVNAVRRLSAVAEGQLSLKSSDIAVLKAGAAPLVGSKVGLTIIAQFPDDPVTPTADAINFPTTKAKIERYSNGVGYTEDGNTGSIRDYFYDQSLGKLEYTQIVTKIVTLPKPRNYYNFLDYPANKQFHPEAGRVLLTDAIAVLQKDNFDFTGLSTDSSNRAIATNVFFAGKDSGVWAQGLWPHQWSLRTPIRVGTNAKPVSIFSYQMTNIADSSPPIGTFCHENGHLILDYPDLYDYGGDSEGVGDHCLMGGGNYNNRGKTPAPLNGYFKDVVGWGNLVDISSEDFMTVSLRTTGNRGYRIRKPGTPTEFFVFENRGIGDKWATYAKDKGIAIWHVDENVYGNDSQEMTQDQHYQVSIEQADGRFDLESNRNRGDTSDFFDLSSPRFNDKTNPDAKWWDGTASSIRFEVLGQVGASTEVLFGSVPPNTIIVGSPNGGEMLYPSSNFDIHWKANIQGNVQISLFKNGKIHSSIAKNVPNTGTYTWSVDQNMVGGKDFTLRIQSVSNPVPAVDFSDAPFAIGEITFPLGDKLPYGWFKPAKAHAGWMVTPSEVYEGTHALVNRPIRDGEMAAVAYRSDFKEGRVSFYMKVSSEKGFDLGRFYINGKLQKFPIQAARKGLSGKIGWTQFIYPIPAGTHTLMWTYEKDDSYSEQKDSAWLDGVSLPETTQNIAVSLAGGSQLSNGVGSNNLQDTPIDKQSRELVFIIKNVGKADLTNLSLKSGGAFIAGPLKKKVLLAGESMQVPVVFAPKKLGLHKRTLTILSNDDDEPEFRVLLRGNGLGVPAIAVFQPTTNRLKNGSELIKFGSATIGVVGNKKTFTVKNLGNGDLTGLAISKSGAGRKDFKVSSLPTLSLAPGESTTFTVTFSPISVEGRRFAGIRISSNDEKTGPFDIPVSGTSYKLGRFGLQDGGLSSSTSLGLVASTLGTQVTSTTAVEVIDGQKFLTLTIGKPPGSQFKPVVEVSPNLLDWFSGKNHTTVLIDNDSILKVRDNTPITQDAKRYIRVR
jgi:M6 family metalloprotease-like protein